jgi:hypothetical protein
MMEKTQYLAPLPPLTYIIHLLDSLHQGKRIVSVPLPRSLLRNCKELNKDLRCVYMCTCTCVTAYLP